MEYIVCSDLESVYIPETWICIAEKTGIDELRRTTRDTPDYDQLMKDRIRILDENGLTLSALQGHVDSEMPYEGAKELIRWIRDRTQLIILSDIFKELAIPFMKKLDMPTLFCNRLVVEDDKVVGNKLRQMGGKRKVVLAMKTINYKVIAFGDSYNDIDMIKEADVGFLFKPSQKLMDEFPEIPVANSFDEAKVMLEMYSGE